MGSRIAAHHRGKLSTPLGRALGGMLKSVAQQSVAVPASSGEALGWELEGLPDEELELDVTQRFVRLAAEAARDASEDVELVERC
jgi:hypothetical protein